MHNERSMAWIGLLVFGLFTALGIYLAVRDTDGPFFLGILSALFVGLAVWYPFWLALRRRRIEALISQCEGGTGSGGQGP